MKYRVPVLETFGWQEPVKSTTINAAPGSPTKGDRYIIPLAVVPLDEWDGHANDIVWYNGVEWKYDTPEAGWSTFVEAQLLAFTYNGTEWGVAEAGAVVTTELFVDKNRVDTYPENGSRSLPYKTIMDAVNSVIASGDNTIDKAYSINMLPGVYDENLTFESSSLVNLTLKGSSVNSTYLRPNAGSAVQSIANNDGLQELIFKDLSIDKPIVLIGASAATEFGAALTFNDVKLTPEATLTVTNSKTLYIFGDHMVHSDVSLQNVGMISLSNDSGMTIGKALNISVLPAANMPAGVTNTTAYIYGNTIQRDIVWDLTGGGVANLYVATAILGASETNDVEIPVGATYTAVNSTLVGNYTYNGDLNLRGSFVTGVLDPASTGNLSMKVQSADMMSLGLPPDGALSDGLIDLADDSTVVYAIDELNEVMKDLAPPQANTLEGVVLADNRTTYVGRVPTGLDNNAWMNAETLSAGDQLSNVIISNSITLSSGSGAPDSFNPPGTVPVDPATTDSAQFRKGDEGLLLAKHQIGDGTFDTVATLDVAGNFKENPPGSSPPRPYQQDLSTWDDAGNGDACTNAIVTFSNARGTLQVTDVRWFNDFNKWQKMNAQFNISSLDPGYNKFQMIHDLAQDESSAEVDFYYADNSTAMVFSTAPTIVQNVLSSTKYVSGIRYYDTGDTFDVAYAGDNVFANIYHSTRCSMFRFEGRSSDNNQQPASPPAITDTFTIAETVAINRTGYYDSDSRVTANFYHPYKSSISQTTATERRLVNTHLVGRSTDIQEYFTDEDYRLADGTHNVVPTLTGNWDSSLVVGAGDAIVGGGSVPSVKAGTVNFSTGYLPTGSPDYSGRTGNEVYLRSFESASANSGFTLELQGLTGSDLGVLGAGNVNVEIKLPGQTGWLDAGKAFNSSQFAGIDGDGCQTAQSGDDWTITFGTFTTANCQGTIVVRVTFRNTTEAITRMTANNF